MKKSAQRNTLPLLVIALALAFIGLSQFVVSSRAQDKMQLPARSGFVNDFAGVVDDATRQRLEVLLANLKQRSGIEFGIATIQTTGARDIFEVSRELASDWNLGARNSRNKSLLLVLAVNEKTAFTQFSRSVQTDLPQGILGEISQIMRSPISAGRFSQGLNDGVNHFIGSLAKKAGFPADGIDQEAVASGQQVESKAAPTPAPVESTLVETTATEKPSVTTTSVKVEKAKEKPAAPAKSSKSTYVNTPEDDADESEEVELVLTLPLAERVAKLKEFLDAFPNSKSKPRAIELLVSTYASLGDLKLKDGDHEGGLRNLLLAISEAPTSISDKLYSGVVAQVPSNLYLRGEREAAIDAARKIEEKFGADPKRLLVLSAFYLGIEDGPEAARLAGEAVKLAPEMADAHRALGLGLHIALRLDEAAAEYKRALELDPNTKKATRRSLADLHRASGKTEEALALYREQLTLDPTDRAARAGVVLSLLELGRSEEGQKELDAALAKDPPDLILLAGAAYWFVAHNQSERALKLAQQAVQLEPRYTWSQIALARALTAQKRPLEAERAIRFAGQYGKFPTLDYELASVLASAGLYDEAADVLLRSFSYDRGQVVTRLAGRLLTRADTFTELLAPERRASIFQFKGADSPGDAAILKSLLAFIKATEVVEKVRLDEVQAAAAAKEFASGNDNMLAHRQIFAASRLLRLGVGLQTAFELTEAARSSIDAALDVPAVTVAAQAEELRDMRARALAQGSTPNVPEAPRNVLGNIMRGRVEDLAGQALLKQDKTALSIEHFKRAVTTLPEGTPAWRNALWHLGTALDQDQQPQEALTYYIRSYNAGNPDAVRRIVIEHLYRKINGSLAGLDERIGADLMASQAPTRVVGTPAVTDPTPTQSPVAAVAAAVSSDTKPIASSATPEATPSPAPAQPIVETTPEVAPTPDPSPSPEAPAAKPEAKPAGSPQHVGTPDPLSGVTRARLATRVKLTGSVKNAAGQGIVSVTMVLVSPRGMVLTATTDLDGNYTFVVTPSPQSYRIIPSKDGFKFAPVDKILTGMIEDQGAVDFVAEPVP